MALALIAISLFLKDRIQIGHRLLIRAPLKRSGTAAC